MVPPPPVVGGGESQIYLAASTVAAATEYVGVGSSSNNFARNTVVIPQNAIITGMVFNIRDNTLTAGQSATADIVLSKTCGFGTIIDTGITATVTGPNNATTPNCCATTTANYPVNGCDLLSVRVTTAGGGALQEGVAVTISYITP
ncbi:hypothetical protein [Sporosarcina cyprini]|uniref:hypothetical protein n=1 Tax=Sporosarcina cyprini TaxID=2910523 RepID=UPI001EDFE1A2|nr:hypothetical protein [Sporosarcina cyprini]MCG3087208.1 hypothetical protein [Sporosarcina cyprini]